MRTRILIFFVFLFAIAGFAGAFEYHSFGGAVLSTDATLNFTVDGTAWHGQVIVPAENLLQTEALFADGVSVADLQVVLDYRRQFNFIYGDGGDIAGTQYWKLELAPGEWVAVRIYSTDVDSFERDVMELLPVTNPRQPKPLSCWDAREAAAPVYCSCSEKPPILCTCCEVRSGRLTNPQIFDLWAQRTGLGL